MSGRPARRVTALLFVGLALAFVAPAALAGKPVGIARPVPSKCDARKLAAAADGGLWVTCVGPLGLHHLVGSVGAVGPSGKLRVFRGPFPRDGEPGPIAVAADGNAWVGISFGISVAPPDRISPVIARVSPTGEVAILPTGLPKNQQIDELVVSPTGPVWFTASTLDGSHASLWQVPPGGKPTRLHVALGQDGASNLESGPEGDVWFRKRISIEPFQTVLARLTPTGEVTEFGASIPGFNPSSAVTTTDGTRWFFSGTEPGSLDRLAPAGEIATVAGAGEASAFGADGVLGLEGDAWFTVRRQDPAKVAIARVTPAGELTEFDDCLSYSQNGFGPDRLAVGADGDLWFTSVMTRELPSISDPPFVGRVTPEGQIAPIFTGVEGEPDAIAATSDGSVWFTTTAGKLERIAPIHGPINTFRVGPPFFSDKENGSTTFRMNVPGPGTVRVQPLAYVHGKHLAEAVPIHAPASATAAAACGAQEVPIRPLGAALRAYRMKGKVTEKVRVTFTPAGGTPFSEVGYLTLAREPSRRARDSASRRR